MLHSCPRFDFSDAQKSEVSDFQIADQINSSSKSGKKQAQLRVPHSKLFYIEKHTIIDDDEKF